MLTTLSFEIAVVQYALTTRCRVQETENTRELPLLFNAHARRLFNSQEYSNVGETLFLGGFISTTRIFV